MAALNDSDAGNVARAQHSDPLPAVGSSSGVYILQAARMVGTSSATIRMWEKYGLIHPTRTSADYRIYSMEQIARLRQIHRLSLEGVNPAGILRILEEDNALHVQVAHDGGGQRGRSVGETLRRLRADSGKTLRQVAAETGLSPSYVNSVERSLATPSLTSLQKLAVAFGTNVQGLMSEPGAAPDTVLVRAAERRVLDSGHGVTIEDMSTAASNLESLLFTIQPGAGSDGAFNHEGEEMLYMVSGRLVLQLDGTDDYELEAGDSMSYDSSRPHAWENPGTEPTVLVWVNTPRTF